MIKQQITFYKLGTTVLAIDLALTTSHLAIASPTINHDATSGDVTPTSAIVWSRADLDAEIVVRFQPITGSSKKVSGSFRTTLDIDTDAMVSLIWSGDLAGQKYCRKADEGYNIFKPMTAYKADFYVANADMIYADDVCPKKSFEKGWTNIRGDFLSVSDPKVDWTNLKQLQDQYNAHW